jgi:hypothetical protein
VVVSEHDHVGDGLVDQGRILKSHDPNVKCLHLLGYVLSYYWHINVECHSPNYTIQLYTMLVISGLVIFFDIYYHNMLFYPVAYIGVYAILLVISV